MKLNSKHKIINCIKAPSRRDDMISLLYLLLHLKDGMLPWGSTPNCGNLREKFIKIRAIKKEFHSYLHRKQIKC
jgi:hypothetical protein